MRQYNHDFLKTATQAGMTSLLMLASAGATEHAAAASLAEEQRAARVASWIDDNVPRYMQQSRMPGFSIAVVQHGETIYMRGFGARDPAHNLPATVDTLFGIGSVTKSFVAIAIMQLVESGAIRLDDPVSRYLPVQLDDGLRPITIHHLLTHSSGLPGLGSSTVVLDRGLGKDTGVPFTSVTDFYGFINGARAEIVAPPGERYFYSNESFRLLGHIIQTLTRMPFHQYLQRRVIRPLGMQRTTLELQAFESDPDHIVPHLRTADGMEPKRFPYPDLSDDRGAMSFIGAAGGIVSSVREMTHYLNAQIARGRHPGGQLASEESFGRMQSMQMKTSDEASGLDGYGYGLRVTPDFLGHVLVSHGGSIVVSTAHMAFVPDLGVGVVMMGNSSGMPFSDIAESVLSILAGSDPAMLPQAKHRDRMNSLTGTYQTYLGLESLKVINDGGVLYLEWPSESGADAGRTLLIPEDATLERLDFYTLSNGERSPVDFSLREGGMTLCIGSSCYRRKH